MKDKIAISIGKRDGDKVYYDITINGEEFKDVPCLPKFENCNKYDCKYYYECSQEGIVRLFDCEKNAHIARTIWYLVTGVVVIILANLFYRTCNLGFWKGTAAFLVSVVILDFVCCLIEGMIETVRNQFFYHRLKKKQEREKMAEEQRRLAEEAKKMQEQAEVDAKDPNRVKIREAETVLAQIAVLSDAVDFGACDERVAFCVEKSREIIEYLKMDSSGYIRVESLLQVYLPEFYKILAYYAEFVKAEAVEKVQKQRFEDIVNYFYNFLCEQKVEAIFDTKATEIKFNASVDTLKKEIEKRGCKL